MVYTYCVIRNVCQLEILKTLVKMVFRQKDGFIYATCRNNYLCVFASLDLDPGSGTRLS